MLTLAHRGYHAEAIENTMAAFEAAVNLGVDGIETDVRLSADNKLVIIHDRVTPKKRAVSELCHDDLQRDLGHAVPLLAEALEAFPSVLWNIELKNPEALPLALPVLRHYRSSRRMLVTSFRHDVAVMCAGELRVDCGLLLASRPLDLDAVISRCAKAPRLKCIVWDYNIVDTDMLEAASRSRFENYVYGAVTRAEHERCASLNLAGLITDYPRLLLKSAGGSD